MTVGIMQPYFFPYLGYFQLMAACDVYVIYDNIKFTKKGWIHRNRMLLNGKDHMFSLPLKSDSDFLDISERSLADNFDKERAKILGQIRSSYAKAPHFADAYPVAERIFNCPETNLFAYIHNSLIELRQYLGITVPMVVSSTIAADHSLKGKDRVMAICKALQGDTYLNPIGGMELYDKAEFSENNINLIFHKMRPITYPQGSNEFISYLSILDVMMYNSRDRIQELLREFDVL